MLLKFVQTTISIYQVSSLYNILMHSSLKNYIILEYIIDNIAELVPSPTEVGARKDLGP